jgi:peptidoglycan/LPS O-acetylase OafA/YrhL
MDHRYRSMDLLRALAILLVILAHTVFSYGAPEHLAPLQFGGTGVDLFFVLSGWLLGSQLFKEFDKTQSINIKRFWIRRWMRTLPAYYAILTLSVVQRLTTKEGVSFPFDYFVFIQNYNFPLEFFSISWSLCVEEQFYLMIAPLIAVLLQFFRRLTLPILIFLLCLPILFRSLELYSYSKETHVAMDGCIMGVLLACIRARHQQIWQTLCKYSTPILIASVSSYVFFYYARYNPELNITDPDRLGLSFMFAGFVVFANASSMKQNALYLPGAKYIATRAYALYLLHPEILALLRRFSEELPFLLYLAIAIAGSLAASEFLYRFIEKPIMDAREKYNFSR